MTAIETSYEGPTDTAVTIVKCTKQVPEICVRYVIRSRSDIILNYFKWLIPYFKNDHKWRFTGDDYTDIGYKTPCPNIESLDIRREYQMVKQLYWIIQLNFCELPNQISILR